MRHLNLLQQKLKMKSEINITIPRAFSPSKNNNTLLLEAAKRYDHEYLIALLQEDPNNVVDDQGRNALHVLLQDEVLGHLNENDMIICLQLLIRSKVDVNLQDRTGKTPLSLAVENRFEKCTLLLLEAGAHCSIKLATKIAHQMPDVMMEIFDSGITTEESKDGINIKLDWKHVLQFPQASSDGDISFKRKQKETQFLYDILDVRPEIRKRFLYHPLVESFVFLKNEKMSRRLQWFYIVSIFYPILYGIFIYFLYFDRCKLSEATANSEAKARCDITVTITVGASLLLVVVGAWTLVEIYMQLRVDRKYLLSWPTWVIRVSMLVMGVTLWPALHYDDGYNITFQYPIASIGIFLSWVIFLIQIGLYTKFSIYLEMLVQILLSVLKIILMFLPLFLGYFMGFNLMFKDMNSIFGFIMMSVDVGSVGNEDLDDKSKNLDDIWFKILAYSFSVTFLITIAIVFMNFLLAVSISDVEGLKGQAKVARISRMIQNIFIVDLIYQNSLLVKTEDLRQGKCYFEYNPNNIKQELSKEIRQNIIRLLKTKEAKRRQIQLQNTQYETLKIGNNVNSEAFQLLFKKIADVEHKLSNLQLKISSPSTK